MLVRSRAQLKLFAFKPNLRLPHSRTISISMPQNSATVFSTNPYALERQVAISAVRRACRLTSSVFNKLVRNETLTKNDKSPVTVGDFAAQALISTMLYHAFPSDPIVGEEDSSDLRIPSGAEMRDRIVSLANDALVLPLESGDVSTWGIGPGRELSTEDILDAIDRGSFDGGRNGRMWTIDPIDGTKGFLRGEQYAVCLALIVDSQVQVGVIGCPNLPYAFESIGNSKSTVTSTTTIVDETGCLFVAVRGQGSQQLPLFGQSPPFTLQIPRVSLDSINFLESVEAAHSSHSFNDEVAKLLGIAVPPLRMDSQTKYGVLARGQGGVYLRMPVGLGYREKIWDHAPGSLLIEEAGGLVSDSRGEKLDFGLGRTLGENYGVIAAGKGVFESVLKAVKEVKSLEENAKAKV